MLCFLQLTINSRKDRRLWFSIRFQPCNFASLRDGLRMGNVGGLASLVLSFVLNLLWCGGSLLCFIESFTCLAKSFETNGKKTTWSQDRNICSTNRKCPIYTMDNIITKTLLFSKPVLTYNKHTKTKIILHRLDPKTFNSQVDR
jgi:hypothetical protein